MALGDNFLIGDSQEVDWLKQDRKLVMLHLIAFDRNRGNMFREQCFSVHINTEGIFGNAQKLCVQRENTNKTKYIFSHCSKISKSNAELWMFLPNKDTATSRGTEVFLQWLINTYQRTVIKI